MGMSFEPDVATTLAKVLGSGPRASGSERNQLRTIENATVPAAEGPKTLGAQVNRNRFRTLVLDIRGPSRVGALLPPRVRAAKASVAQKRLDEVRPFRAIKQRRLRRQSLPPAGGNG